jgi:hypothetical protein
MRQRTYERIVTRLEDVEARRDGLLIPALARFFMRYGPDPFAD